MTSYIQLYNKYLPEDIINHINAYLLPKKIPKDDERYKILLKIPLKEYDPTDGVTYVYMRINEDKDYYITNKDSVMQIMVLIYHSDYSVHAITVDYVEI